MGGRGRVDGGSLEACATGVTCTVEADARGAFPCCHHGYVCLPTYRCQVYLDIPGRGVFITTTIFSSPNFLGHFFFLNDGRT